MRYSSLALGTPPPSHPPLSPETVEQRLVHARLFAARLQLLVSSALVWLIFVLGAVAGGIPPLLPTLALGAWIIASTLWLSLLALRSSPETLTGETPGRIALICTLLTVILATLLVRDTATDFYLIYFFPIAVATIYFGLRGGVAAAGLCAISYAYLSILYHSGAATSEFVFVMVVRIVLLFALVGTLGVSAEGQLALTRELGQAYADLKATTANLQGAHLELTRLLNEATTLDHIAREITATLDTERVLSRVLGHVQTLVDAEASTLMTLDGATDELVFQIPHGAQSRRLQGYRLPVGEGLAGWVAAHNEPLRVADVSADPRFTGCVDAASGFHTRSALVVPLRSQARVTGVLEVINKRHGTFTPEDERLCSSVARWAAIALENARLYREVNASMEQLAAAQTELLRSERLRALGEVAGGVAHDFNNLLTVILADAQLLETSLQEPAERARAERIEQAARDGTEVVRRIRESTRVPQTVVQETVNVSALLHQVAAMTRPRWSPFGTLELQLEPTPDVVGSPAELREILMNLVLNAVEARRAGTSLQVQLRSRVQGERVVIQVEDNGSGIPPALQSQIFDPYFTTKAQGTGLGLSVASGLVARHGGEIEVTSPLVIAPNEAYGARFTLRLPFANQ